MCPQYLALWMQTERSHSCVNAYWLWWQTEARSDSSALTPSHWPKVTRNEKHKGQVQDYSDQQDLNSFVSLRWGWEVHLRQELSASCQTAQITTKTDPMPNVTCNGEKQGWLQASAVNISPSQFTLKHSTDVFSGTVKINILCVRGHIFPFPCIPSIKQPGFAFFKYVTELNKISPAIFPQCCLSWWTLKANLMIIREYANFHFWT